MLTFTKPRIEVWLAIWIPWSLKGYLVLWFGADPLSIKNTFPGFQKAVKGKVEPQTKQPDFQSFRTQITLKLSRKQTWPKRITAKLKCLLYANPKWSMFWSPQQKWEYPNKNNVFMPLKRKKNLFFFMEHFVLNLSVKYVLTALKLLPHFFFSPQLKWIFDLKKTTEKAPQKCNENQHPPQVFG